MQVDNAGEWVRSLRMLPTLVISAIIIVAASTAAGNIIIPSQSAIKLTGIVSDSICGADHGIMAPGDAECTRSCVELGARYALMVGKIKVGKKMYMLLGHDADLYRFAGTEVTVKGRALDRNTIIVDQVERSYEAAKNKLTG